MAKVTVTLTGVTKSFPLGTLPGPFRVTLKPATGDELFLEQSDKVFVFEDVPVGSYDIIAERAAADGTTLGDKVTVAFTVAPTTTEIEVPVSLVAVQG